MDYAAGRTFVDELNGAAARLGTVYRHRWRPRQLVVWDNRCLMHRATEYDTANERRVIRRCTVLGDTPFRIRPGSGDAKTTPSRGCTTSQRTRSTP